MNREYDTMRFEKTFHLSASREQAWELVAHTDRLNRELGLPPILFTFTPRAIGGTEAYATIRLGALTLRYREHPFEWVRPVHYHFRRVFEEGPIREIRGGTHLQEEGNGTLVTVWAELDPANALGKVACRVVGTKSINDFISVGRRFESYLTRQALTPYPRHSRKPPTHAERLRQKLALLRQAGIEEGLAERLGDFIAHAPPEDTVSIRPFVLADTWQRSRMDVLRTCLTAASKQVGLLEMRWRVLCPACRGGRQGAEHLTDIDETVHCETCNIRFNTEFDRSVEVCFSIAPTVRAVQETTYCVSGPALSPHIVAQWVLEPGTKRTTPLGLPEGAYALASLQVKNPAHFHVSGEGADRMQATLLSDSADGNGKPRLLLGPHEGPVCPNMTWSVANDTSETIVLRLETPEWTADAATAALVTSLQSFRDQFGSEVLSAGTELAIRQVCILFSDLKGSTAMYREKGDAPSYRAVNDHFVFMRKTIEAHHGAIIKTIGDAVMAAFHDPTDALNAALAIQRVQLRERNAPEGTEGLTVKLGLHYGPAIAVTANGMLDYFGQTINLAARLQRESEGGDIVLAASLAEDPPVQRLLANPTITTTYFEAPLRGLEEPVRMLRVQVQ